MFTRIGGWGRCVEFTGTGCQVEEEEGRISSPGWPGRRKRRVRVP